MTLVFADIFYDKMTKRKPPTGVSGLERYDGRFIFVPVRRVLYGVAYNLSNRCYRFDLQ